MCVVSTDSTEILRRRVTDALLEFLQDQRHAIEPEASALIDELEAIVRAGGKRIRPRFCYWGFRAAGGDDGPEVIRIGSALELLHTFALIYDDVMDRSPLRRKRRSSFQGMGGGMSAALLTGILGFVLADHLLWTSGLPADRLSAVTDRYDAMRARAIAGQYMDVVASRNADTDEHTVRRIGALKSGSYSVNDPLAIGALAGGGSPEFVSALAGYGEPLGEAFQIADDILGAFGDPEITGKDADGDFREGKQTVLLTKARALAEANDRAALDELIGCSDLDAPGAETVRGIMRRCGALDATRSLVVRLRTEALDALDKARLPDNAAAALRELAIEATIRDE